MFYKCEFILFSLQARNLSQFCLSNGNGTWKVEKDDDWETKYLQMCVHILYVTSKGVTQFREKDKESKQCFALTMLYS